MNKIFMCISYAVSVYAISKYIIYPFTLILGRFVNNLISIPLAVILYILGAICVGYIVWYVWRD